MKKAVIYARYSSDSPTKQSIEGQLRVRREYTEKNDILIIDTYIDQAMTGTNVNRAAFQQMLADSRKKQWDIVLVYKLDRFARNKYESVINKKILNDNGLSLVSAMEQIADTLYSQGYMAVGIVKLFKKKVIGAKMATISTKNIFIEYCTIFDIRTKLNTTESCMIAFFRKSFQTSCGRK